MEKTSDLFCNKSLGWSMRRSGAVSMSFWYFAYISLRCYDIKQSNIIFLQSAMQEIHVNISITVKTVDGISLGCNYFFIVFYVLESK